MWLEPTVDDKSTGRMLSSMLTSDSHRLDALKSFLGRFDLVVVELVRQPELVEHLELAPLIPDSLEGVWRHSRQIKMTIRGSGFNGYAKLL